MELNQDLQAKLDQIAKLPSTVRGAILVAVALLLAGGYFLVVYRDSGRELDRLHAKELELQRKLSEVRSIAANIGEFEEEITNLEFKLQRILRQLPNQKELDALLTDISNLGKTAGVEIKSFRRRDEVIHGFYAEVPIDIEIEGEYHNIARFFDMMARLPRIVNMGSIDVKVAKDTLEATVLKVSGTATTFRFVGKGGSA